MINDEITNYFNSLYLDEFSNVGVELHHTYFWHTFDEPTEDEIKEFGENIKILCFRTVGYTIGHIILNKNSNAIKFVVYNHDHSNQFKLNHSELETELNKRFIGAKISKGVLDM